MKQSYPRTSEYLLQGHLSKLFGVTGHRLQDVLQAVSSCPANMPFDIAEVVVVLEKFPILAALLRPKKVPIFRELMLELDHGTPVLITDSQLTSRDSVYVAVGYEADEIGPVVSKWLDCQPRKHQIFLGSIEDTVVVSAPLLTFSCA
jgi:hypothetical protein